MSAGTDTGYSTHHYVLVTGVGEWDSPCKGFPVYKLVNRHSGQVEGEGISLPQAIFSLIGATASLDEANEIYYAEPEVASEGEIH